MKRTILGCLSLSLLATAGSAQKAHTTLHARAQGGVVRAAIRIEIDEGWHLYHHELGHPDAAAKPTVVELGGDGIEWTDVAWPEPEVIDQSAIGAGVFVLGHHGEIVLYAAGRLADGSGDADEAGEGAAELEISGLTCLENGSCIPYRESVRAQGAGPDELFDDFPGDLVPAGWATEPVEPEPAPVGPAEEVGEAEEAERVQVADAPASGPVRGGEASFELFTRADGGLVRALLVIDVEDDWHLFHEDMGHPDAAAQPTTLDWRGAGITWGQARWPEPDYLDQSDIMGAGVYALGHHGRIEVAIVGRLDEGARAEDASVGVAGQTCLDDGQCIPIRGLTVRSSGAGSDERFATFPADLEAPADPGAAGDPSGGDESGVPGDGSGDAGTSGDLESTVDPTGDPAAGSGGGASGNAGSVTGDSSSSKIPESKVIARLGRTYEPRERGIGASEEGGGEERGLAMWMLLAFVAGMILNIMPCVLPVVSIKVLSFVNQAGESRGRIFALGSMFSFGILAVFLVLGALAAFAGKNWGSQFQSVEFLVVMIAVVFAFSLSLFGLFELGVPQAVGQMAGQQQRREGLVGAFSMGILSTLLATPCSGPFLGSTLAWAVTQPTSVILAIFGMAGVGMAFPYAILTSNPAFLKFVPKPGPWMETFKHLMGFLLLFTVLFLMASVPEKDMLYLLTFLVFVGLGCWIWGHFATFDQKPGRRLVTVGWVVLAFLGGGFLSFRTLPAFFAEEEIWEPFDMDRLVAYQDEGRNVFVDFTADWCLTCKTNEKVVYEAEDTLALFDQKGVAVMKADETNIDDLNVQWIMALRNHLGSQSIPFSAVFPGNDPSRPMIFRDLVTPEGFRAALEALPDPR